MVLFGQEVGFMWPDGGSCVAWYLVVFNMMVRVVWLVGGFHAAREDEGFKRMDNCA